MHYIGGIQFAMILIGTVALFVVVGTFIESLTESHQYASHFTYSNPLFIALLWGFFANILVSALRRWPFKWYHIPFLITHLGLLMILAGALYKNYAGIQGNMGIMEGSGSHEIFLPYTYVVKAEKKNNDEGYYELGSTWRGEFIPKLTSKNPTAMSELEMRLIAYVPHSKTVLETWIKGDKGYITGIQPFPVYDWINVSSTALLPTSTRIRMHHKEAAPWRLIALTDADPLEAAQKSYLDGLNIIVSDRATQEILYKGPLNGPIKWPGGEALAELHLNYSLSSGFVEPRVHVIFRESSLLKQESISMPLSGSDSLLNTNEESSYLGAFPIVFDLMREEPILTLIQDPQGDIYFFAFDSSGTVDVKSYRSDSLNSLIVYDEGFGGYAVHYTLPFASYAMNRSVSEHANLYHIGQQIKKGLESATGLSPPLQLLYQACQKSHVDFTGTFLHFLSLWNTTHQWLYPTSQILPTDLSKVILKLDWMDFKEELKASYWASALFTDLPADCHILQALEMRGWPLLDELKKLQKNKSNCTPEETASILTALTRQLFTVADQLPDTVQEINLLTAENQAHLFSAFLRAYSLHLSDLVLPGHEDERALPLRNYLASKWLFSELAELIAPLQTHSSQEVIEVVRGFPPQTATFTQIRQAFYEYQQLIGNLNQPEMDKDALVKELFTIAPLQGDSIAIADSGRLKRDLEAGAVVLEAPLSRRIVEQIPGKKLEDNVPKITLEVAENGKKEMVTLPYDLVGMGLKWPVLGGNYLLRFQPMFKTIPYHLRLRHARQINYANSSQPYSFESDLLISDRSGEDIVEKTVSMNHVYETWEGYRFYLSNMAPSEEGAVKRVQIIVNHDPGKYWLTYPGALILTLGIILLFWLKPYAMMRKK